MIARLRWSCLLADEGEMTYAVQMAGLYTSE